MFCSFDAPNKVDRVGVSAQGVSTRAFQNEFAGIQTATKHVKMRPQIKQGAHQQIDLEFEENVFSLQVVNCLQTVERRDVDFSALYPKPPSFLPLCL